jgi:AraC family transcriptional regulator of adaptative response / DNA-3-methyladenine glycosylase II
MTALDDEQRYQAAVSKDPRFDGVFFIAVTSTGIFLPGDVGVLDALRRLGAVPGGSGGPAGRGSRARASSSGAAAALAEGWRPWRSYAVHHLWASLEPVTGFPEKGQL